MDAELTVNCSQVHYVVGPLCFIEIVDTSLKMCLYNQVQSTFDPLKFQLPTVINTTINSVIMDVNVHNIGT